MADDSKRKRPILGCTVSVINFLIACAVGGLVAFQMSQFLAFEGEVSGDVDAGADSMVVIVAFVVAWFIAIAIGHWLTRRLFR